MTATDTIQSHDARQTQITSTTSKQSRADTGGKLPEQPQLIRRETTQSGFQTAQPHTFSVFSTSPAPEPPRIIMD